MFDEFLRVLLFDGRGDVLERLESAGFGPDEVLEYCSRPNADRDIMLAGIRRHVLPQLPAILRDMSKSAAGGDQKAQTAVLGLLTSKGVMSDLGDLGSLSDAALDLQAGVIMERLSALRGPGSSEAPTTESAPPDPIPSPEE